ncbi:30887_t:CDS:2 [Gigaspora margarita]|uniref:30887_t:CDS:1 n=1 Tax=Gigaspora margarita TaxID=4874 RepID=A0ABN7W0T6_GIGMA|nr:30887_t:CDS:2 [Gigaspora margarita]
MAQNRLYRLTKYIYIQDKLGPNQSAKQAICEAWLELWKVDEDQEVIMYEDPDENMACNAIRAL